MPWFSFHTVNCYCEFSMSVILKRDWSCDHDFYISWQSRDHDFYIMKKISRSRLSYLVINLMITTFTSRDKSLDHHFYISRYISWSRLLYLAIYLLITTFISRDISLDHNFYISRYISWSRRLNLIITTIEYNDDFCMSVWNTCSIYLGRYIANN